MVSPIKAPSSAGRPAAGKSESADPPPAPGRPEFAASLQGVFALVDAIPKVRQAQDPVRQDAGEPAPAEPFPASSDPGSRPDLSGFPQGGASRVEPGEEVAPDLRPIDRAIEVLDELRLREGLKPAPEAPRPEGRLELPALAEAGGEVPAPAAEAMADPVPALPAPEPPEEVTAADLSPDLEIPAAPGTANGTEMDSADVVAGPKAPPLPVAVEILASEAGEEPVPDSREDGAPLPAMPAAQAGVEVRGGAVPAARGSGPTTPAETVDRVVQAAQLLRSRGATRLRLRLDPPSLGSLKVDLTVRKGVLEGRLTAESVQARDVLAAQMERLKEQLAAQGLNVGEFQVGVDQSFHQAPEDPSWTGRGAGRGKGGAAGEPEPAVVEEVPGRASRGAQVIDVRI